MTLSATVVLATHNAGKVSEFRRLLEQSPLRGALRWQTAPDLGLAVPEETAPTYLGNAEIKARAAAEATGLRALADDTGLEIDAMSAGPGVRTAEFADRHGGWSGAYEAIAEATGLRTVSEPLGATAVCQLVLFTPGAPPLEAQARIVGHLRWPPIAELPGFAAIFDADADTPFCTDHVLLHRRRAFSLLVSAIESTASA